MLVVNISKALMLGTALLAPGGYCGQMVKAVWKLGSFNTISPPSGGPMYGNDAGFAIMKEDGGVIYQVNYPGGYSPCMGNSGNGATFSLTGGCLKDGGEFQFNCYTESGLSPSNCAARDKFGNDLATGKGSKDYAFTGISMGIDGWCGVEFELGDGVDCEPGVTGFKAVNIEGGR
ncbi:hypothetical protein PENSTE_c015G06420 [Penicillium steckii]|uniref:AA1-like domain-containing protein n=1 Tax=Penicillium steckii TaxID=303698 RepID=A0A1V6T0B8_9EURO|nr:hypothetical protein PENSTE_c015G06420 [Penicillium steckii]